MKRLYLRVTPYHARALARYGFGDPNVTMLFAAHPPKNDIFTTLVEVMVGRTKQLQECAQGLWLAPAIALQGSSIKVLEQTAARSLTYAGAEEEVLRCSSFDRMTVAICMHPDLLRDDWLRLVGFCWSVCDNTWRHAGELRKLLGTVGPLFPMMTAKELSEYRALPNTVNVYRGGSELNKDGISWSLDREVAAGFPVLNRYKASSPVLYLAKVQKQDILAVKLDRDEREVITFGAKIFSEAPIS